MVYDIGEYFRSPVIIKGDRVVLRKLTVADAGDMYEYAKRKDVTRYLLWEPHQSVDATKRYLKYLQKQYAKGRCFDFAVTLDGKMIGTVGFAGTDAENSAAEIGYVINPLYQNNGYATEALGLIKDLAFGRLGIHRVFCRILEGNEPSRRVCEKNGMCEEAFFRSALFIKGGFRSYYVYSALNAG